MVRAGMVSRKVWLLQLRSSDEGKDRKKKGWVTRYVSEYSSLSSRTPSKYALIKGSSLAHRLGRSHWRKLYIHVLWIMWTVTRSWNPDTIEPHNGLKVMILKPKIQYTVQPEKHFIYSVPSMWLRHLGPIRVSFLQNNMQVLHTYLHLCNIFQVMTVTYGGRSPTLVLQWEIRFLGLVRCNNLIVYVIWTCSCPVQFWGTLTVFLT